MHNDMHLPNGILLNSTTPSLFGNVLNCDTALCTT